MTRSNLRWLDTWIGFSGDSQLTASVEVDRGKRSRKWWPALLSLMASPLLGGAAIAFTNPTVLRSLDRYPTLTALTAFAFLVGAALCATSWPSLFGFQRESRIALILLIAALVWLLRGTGESAAMAILMLVLSCWAYRRHRRELRLRSVAT